jgi:hypothetical protein
LKSWAPGLAFAGTLALLGGCAQTTHPNFSGLWQVADPALIIRPDVNATEADYTAEAWAHIRDYRKNWDTNVDDPAKFCVKHGMPNTMTSRARDYLVDIYQTASRITVLVEFMDNHRVIHFDKTAVPGTVSLSDNGYSMAHWDGDSLLVETAALKATSTVGLMQRSAEAHITERWTLRTDSKLGPILEVDLTVTDPTVFRHPVKARQVFKPAAAGAELNEYGCEDAMWEDHVEAVLAARNAKAK